MELKQNSAPAARLSSKLTPDVATILSQLRARGKKLKTKRETWEAVLENHGEEKPAKPQFVPKPNQP